MSVVSDWPDQGQTEIFLIGVSQALLYFTDDFYRSFDERVYFIQESFDDGLEGLDVSEFGDYL